LSIKTGGCAEDCGYYPQSAHFDTDVKAGKLMPVAELVEAARTAKNQGAMRFCMGAAWRSPKPRDIAAVAELIRLLDRLGLRVQGEGAL
jgi:biotin synthase